MTISDTSSQQISHMGSDNDNISQRSFYADERKYVERGNVSEDMTGNFSLGKYQDEVKKQIGN